MVNIYINKKEYKHFSETLKYKFEKYFEETYGENTIGLVIYRFNNIEDKHRLIYVESYNNNFTADKIGLGNSILKED